MNTAISNESIRQLFTGARTHHAWQDKPLKLNYCMTSTT